MSIVESTKAIKSEEAEKTPSFDELQKQKEELWKEIEEGSLDLSIKDKRIIVSMVLGHSIKDGFDLARRLGLDGYNFGEAMTLIVPYKNKDFLTKFASFVESNKDYVDYTDQYHPTVFLQSIKANVSLSPDHISRSGMDEISKWPYAGKIDDYYANFIRNRRFTSPEVPADSRTQVEATAEDHLLSAEAVLKVSYYTGPIREFLGVEKDSDLEKLSWLTDEDKWELRNKIIEQRTLTRILSHGDIIASRIAEIEDVERIKSTLKSARYVPSKTVFEARKKEAEKGLVKQITDSLIKRGYIEGEFEVKFDETKQEYEVVDKRASAPEVEGKENLREVDKLPDGRFEEGLDWYIIGAFEKKIREEKKYPNIQVQQFLIGRKLIASLERFEGSKLEKYLSWGNTDGYEIIGPYDEIKLCENSKDKLIYYAKKGGEHFVYVDGVEKKIKPLLVDGFEGAEIKVEEIVSVGDDVLLSYVPLDKNYNVRNGTDNKGAGARWKKYIYSIKENTWNYRSQRIRNFSEVGGKLFYIDKQANWVAKWGDKDYYLDPLTSQYNQAVGFNDQVFIVDGKRILSIESGEKGYKEMVFDGTVEVINSGGKLFIIESLPDKKRIWEYSEELELQEREQKDLDLANAVAKEDLTVIENYFDKYYPEENVTIGQMLAAVMIGKEHATSRKKSASEKAKSKLKSALEQSKSFVVSVNQTIKQAPKLFMDTMRAKDDKPTEFLMTQMFYYMYPEAQANKERELREAEERRMNSGGAGGNGRKGRGEGNFDYDAGMEHLSSVDESGYYEMIKANREVLKLREPLPASTFITSGIFGNYIGSGWTKVNVPISEEVRDPAKETTFEFIDEKSGKTINLPKIDNAQIITERLKGITSNDEEVPIKILEENNLGEVRVEKGDDTKRIVYSQTYSEMPKTVAEVTATDYDKFRKGFENSFGDVMTKPIGDVGDELDIFVRGLGDKTPREQVIAIQEFCYEYGYYNLDNQPRDTDNFEERLSIMEYRMDELKAKEPNLAHKKYAGICTDFATLTTALLRRAGFVSGIASGFVPEADSTLVRSDRAHAVSFVLWPNSENKGGKPDMIIVDGTPSSITPRILEQEKKANEMAGELSIDAEKKLVELERILKTMDVEAIRKLQNGELERILNQILYGVKQSHVDVLNRVLNASRYAGFDILEMSRGNIDDQIEFRKFLEEEIYKEKRLMHENRGRRGEELFRSMQEFTRRFEKDKNVNGKEEALDVLEKVLDISEKYLDPIESRSAVAIITYLRARKMR